MKRILSIVAALALALNLAACGASPASSTASSAAASSQASSTSIADAQPAKPTTDRSGAAIRLPDSVNTIISMAPSITQTLINLGCADSIIATDKNSVGIDGLSEDLPIFEMLSPDAEQLAALSPDVVFVSSISSRGGENPFQPLVDLGIAVVCIPTSATINDIYDDITFMGEVLGKNDEAAKINADLKAEIDRIAELGKSVTEKKSVYFEIAAAPNAFSTGSGTYMDEMIQLVGAENILASVDSERGWMSVDPEVVVNANPDVILTNVDYIEDAPAEIMGRDGWSEITAVKNGAVYYIDNTSSSLPNENIVAALEQMGKAIYPEVFGK